MSQILELLRLTPSPQSVDYIENKQQFHLFNLLTEQRHPQTWNLSFAIEADVEAGLRMLLDVDRDVSAKIDELIQDPAGLELAVAAVMEAILSGRTIYVYGCGATGRLAKQMESTLWRPFWRRAKEMPFWPKLRQHLPAEIENLLIGEMTGADRALVSSLEGFEDLQEIGRLQLQDRKVACGDVVICVTEGGETSSVIGTILAALAPYGATDSARAASARTHLFFIYNNPDDLLRPFVRSASILDNDAITKINLTTGPQAITGSTRMQATTIETFVVGTILEQGIERVLRRLLNREEMRALGYGDEMALTQRLQAFDGIRSAVADAVPFIARFTEMESSAYRSGRFTTYFAHDALITVFIDSTERSPTFRLVPMDTVADPERKSWVQVWTKAGDLHEAWRTFLGRDFRGFDPGFYRGPLERDVLDPYLKEAALRSLANAGNDQEFCYDFSLSNANIERRGPQAGDVGVLVLLGDEISALDRHDPCFHRFLDLFHEHHAALCAISVTSRSQSRTAENRLKPYLKEGDILVPVVLPDADDPLSLHRQIALKMLLNAHSTGTMARLGRVIGNTMTSVSPSNLKLIGRATYLVMNHVNDVLLQSSGLNTPAPERVTFVEANAVLMEAIDYIRSKALGQTAEVALTIIRIIESLQRNRRLDWTEAQAILDQEGLAGYLLRHNAALAHKPDKSPCQSV